MNHQESKFRPHSSEDAGGSPAARMPDGQDAQLQSQEWHPLASHAETSREKDHTYTGRTDGETRGAGESSGSRDPEHELNFRGEEIPHPGESRHKGRTHHSGGSSDPGFGAFDRG